MRLKEETDYPAAHSMDSDWFAVDAQGRVALFSTGEDGPYPEQAYGGQGIQYEAADRLYELPYDLSGVEPDGGILGWRGEPWTGNPSIPESCVAWLSGEAGWARVKNLPRTRRLSAGAEVLVRGEWTGAQLISLREAGLLRKAWLGCAIDLPRLGIFTYEFMESDSAPYERTGTPGQPLLLGQLPGELRKQVGRLVLDRVDFARDPRVEPRLFTRCAAYSDEDAGGGPPVA